MAIKKPLHPIRRVRDALKDTPENLDLRKYSTAEGFSKLLGRSSSLVRNVECGITERWQNLAILIERKTMVSCEWLLSKPKSTDPILDVNGNHWEPSLFLDPLAPHENMPDWRQLIHFNPASIPEFVAEAIKAQLILELSIGSENGLSRMISIFRRMQTYQNPVLRQLVEKQKELVRERVAEKIWEQRRTERIVKADLEVNLRVNLDSFTPEAAEKILENQGYDWVSRLDQVPKSGPIPMLLRRYRKRQSVGNDDGDVMD